MDEILNHRYQLKQKLGQGGFGAVYQATDLVLDREVAVKLLTFSGEEQEELTRRFITEARIASKLNHPNALIIYDFGDNTHDGRCFLVSELLVGESLHDRLSRGALPIPNALEVVYQICAVLQEAHKLKIVHRDIKPANIYLSDQDKGQSGFIKLLDFGIAKLMEGKSNTVTGQMMGTPHYMSPEQIVNIKLVDHRTDLYSLGVVLFHALMGHVPFNDESYYAIMRQHMQSPMPPLSLPSTSPALTSALQLILSGMTHKNHQKRTPSAERVMEQIQELWATFPEARRAGGSGVGPSGMFAAISSNPPAIQASPLGLGPEDETAPPEEHMLGAEQTPATSAVQPAFELPPPPSPVPSPKPLQASSPSSAPSSATGELREGPAEDVKSETILKTPQALPPRESSPRWAIYIALASLALGALLWAISPKEPTSTASIEAQPQETAHRVNSATQAGAQEPQAGAQEPQAGAQEPQAGAQEPQAGAQEPQAGAQEAQAGAQEPQAGAQEAQAGAQEAQAGSKSKPSKPAEAEETQTSASARVKTTQRPRQQRSAKPPKLKIKLSKVRAAYDVGDKVRLSWDVQNVSPSLKGVTVETPDFISVKGRTKALKSKGRLTLTFKEKGQGTLKVCFKNKKTLICERLSLKVTAIDSIFQDP